MDLREEQQMASKMAVDVDKYKKYLISIGDKIKGSRK